MTTIFRQYSLKQPAELDRFTIPDKHNEFVIGRNRTRPKATETDGERYLLPRYKEGQLGDRFLYLTRSTDGSNGQEEWTLSPADGQTVTVGEDGKQPIRGKTQISFGQIVTVDGRIKFMLMPFTEDETQLIAPASQDPLPIADDGASFINSLDDSRRRRLP